MQARTEMVIPMQVLGCSKGMLATLTSVFFFRNHVSLLGLMGYTITLMGIYAYGWARHKSEVRC